MKIKRDKRAAIEMSVGTIVTIVLMVSMLVLGLVLIRGIFSAGKSAIIQIDSKTKSQIDQLFKEDDKKMVVPVPTDRKINIKQGTNQEGFGFVLRNVYNTPMDFSYSVGVDPEFTIENKCNGLTKIGADGWLLARDGTIPLGAGKIQENGELVLFNIPRDAPPCTIPFMVDVKEKSTNRFYQSLKMFVTIEGE